MQMFAFDRYVDRKGDLELVGCWLVDRSMRSALADATDWEVFCSCCGVLTHVPLTPGAPIEVREGLACPHCGLNARLRVAMTTLADIAPDARDIYMTEQATPAFAWLQSRRSGVRGSEFEPDADARVGLGNYLQHLGGHGPVEFQDITQLTFENESLDAILSFDVLEHVPDYAKAIQEFARVLRPGGVLVATFPFTDQADTLVRARLRADGEIEHICTPEFHGDPLGDGVLCFYHFGWDITEVARSAGFSRVGMTMAWAPQNGVLYGHWMLVAYR